MLPKDTASDVILVVDDDPVVVAIIKAILSTNGYQVITAPDGLAAWRMVENAGSNISLVISDITMPNMDGLELAFRLKMTRPDLPVLLISGFISPSHQKTLSGHVNFLAKPFTSQGLLGSVQSILIPRKPASHPRGDAAVA